MKLLVAIFLLVGIGLIVGGGFAAKDTIDLRNVADRVQGTVVGVEESHDSASGTTYAPVYEYVVDGETYRHSASVSSSSHPQMGKVETLLVHPDNPSKVKSDTFLDQWFLAAILGGIGTVFFVVAVVIAIVSTAVSGIGRGLKAAFPEGVPDFTPTAAGAMADLQSKVSTMSASAQGWEPPDPTDAVRPATTATHHAPEHTPDHSDHDPFVGDGDPSIHKGPFL